MQQEILKIKIRPMTKADVENVVKIEELSYGEHHWSKDSFYGELSNDLAHYFCATDESNDILGYCGVWGIIDEAHITNIAVSPKYRKKKIGEALLANIIDFCSKNEIKYITLEVRISNTPAIK